MDSNATTPTSIFTEEKESNSRIYQNLLSLENPVFCCYLFWCSILLMKILLMSMLTVIQRFRKKAVANAEDFKGVEVKTDPEVERIRRAHLNDLENILPFLIMSLIFITTNPIPIVACTLFRIGGAARIFHTIIYVLCQIPQPARLLSFLVTFFVTIFMGICIAVGTMRFI